MNKDNKQMTEQDDELSIWELAGLMRKNWLLLSIVIIIFIIGGLTYSFAIQEQGVTTYTSSEKVMFSDWEYYPAQIYNTYAGNLKSHINNEFGKNIILSSRLIQKENYNDTIDYIVEIEYSTDISKSEAEEAAAFAVLWHNQMVDSEMEKIQRSYEQSLNDLRADYEDLKLEYYSFVSDSDMSSVENMVAADILKSESDIYFETWKNEKAKFQEIKNKWIDAKHYYLESISVNTTVKSTWEVNTILSIVLGFIIGFILVFLNKSYQNHKNNK